MQIGVSSSCYYPMLTENALEIIGKSGIKTSEIFFNSEFEHSEEFVKKLKDIKDRYKINIAALHPALSFGESYYFFSEYMRRFDEYRRVYADYFKAANTLGAKYIIMHGARPAMKISEAEYCKRFLQISKDAKDSGVTLLQENVSGYISQSPDFLIRMRDYTNDEASFCLDIKQAIRAGSTVNDIKSAMNGKIKHIHISDSTPINDCMLPLNGSFDFNGFFSALNRDSYNGVCMIEVYSNAYKSTDEIAKSYFKLVQSSSVF